MKVIHIYEANDGTRFDTQTECAIYEGKQLGDRLFIVDTTRWWIDGKPIEIEADPCDTEKFDRELLYILSASTHVSICVTMPDEIHSFILNSFGINIPKNIGNYRYDEDKDEWIEYDEDVKELKEKWPMMNINF